MKQGNSNYSPNQSADGLLARLKRDHPDTESLCGSAGATGGWPHNTEPNRPLGGGERLKQSLAHTPQTRHRNTHKQNLKQLQETLLARRIQTTDLTIHLLRNIPPQPLQAHGRQPQPIRTLTNLTKQRGVWLPTLQRFTRCSANEKVISNLLNTPQTLPFDRLGHLP